MAKKKILKVALLRGQGCKKELANALLLYSWLIVSTVGQGMDVKINVQEAIQHWHCVAPLLTKPENQANFDLLVEALDELLDIVGDDEASPLIELVHRIGDLVSEYEKQNHPVPDFTSA